MAGRGSHPDELTRREQEVLQLLRMRLTNEEIAQRLGITPDGAKYHVSQILSKLDVGTREEAAGVALAERRPWWLRAAVWAKIAGAATVAAAVAGIALLAWGVIRTKGTGLTVEEVYSRAYASAAKPGSILHTTITSPGVTISQGSQKGQK